MIKEMALYALPDPHEIKRVLADLPKGFEYDPLLQDPRINVKMSFMNPDFKSYNAAKDVLKRLGYKQEFEVKKNGKIFSNFDNKRREMWIQLAIETRGVLLGFFARMG
jgi:hypothetical protein